MNPLLRSREVRCTAPHPKKPGPCDAKIADALPRSITVEQDGEVRPDCVVVVCPRCKTRYRLCVVRMDEAA